MREGGDVIQDHFMISHCVLLSGITHKCFERGSYDDA